MSRRKPWRRYRLRYWLNPAEDHRKPQRPRWWQMYENMKRRLERKFEPED